MVKQKAILEILKNERVYQFMLDPNSPLGEIYDVLVEMKAHVFDLMKQHQDKEMAAREEEQAIKAS